MPDRTYHIRPVLDGQTLAAGLRGLNQKLSWADARRLIHQRHVHVNGNLVVDDARRIKAGDVVKIFEHSRAPVPTAADVRVVYIDEHLVIVDKPAGVTTLRHREEEDWDDRRKQRQPTLDELVQELVPGALHEANRLRWAAQTQPESSQQDGGRDPNASSGGADQGRRDNASSGVIRRPGGRPAPPPSARASQHHRSSAGATHRQNAPAPSTPKPEQRVRPVHRLDRDTSGLMLFALSPLAEQKLVAMFKTHAIRREYVVVVHGRVETPMRLESDLVRDRGDGLRGSSQSLPPPPDAQHAVTHVSPDRVLAGGRYSVVRCRLETGRTHQIRIHLAEAGHMLCGERTYLSPRAGQPPIRDESGAPRQALHSAELELEHPVSGKVLKYSTPLAKDLAQWLTRLATK